MPRPPRCDLPGRWFHLFNRGIARRTVFETRADVRYFLACLAQAARRGEIEVHAYCILTTHFHLLVRSPTGDLAVAMDRVLNAYVRYFNRTRRRDGSLFRGRYGARPVDSLRYRRTLLRYIDRNAVQARLARLPWDFPYGSAWYYTRPRRPRWLTTTWVDAVLREGGHVEPWRGYVAVFGAVWTSSELALVEARMRAPLGREEALDHLIDAAPPAVLAWMRRKATLADGQVPALPCLDARTVLSHVDVQRQASPAWTYVTPKGQRRDAWPLAVAYLLRHLASLEWKRVGETIGTSGEMAGRRARQAQALLLSDPGFGERLSAVAHGALGGVYGGGAGGDGDAAAGRRGR